jgi:hypothetical protein
MSHDNNLGPFHQRSRYSDHVETPPAAMQNTQEFSVHYGMRKLCDGIPARNKQPSNAVGSVLMPKQIRQMQRTASTQRICGGRQSQQQKNLP